MSLTLAAFLKSVTKSGVKLSLDDKRLAVGFGNIGDENLSGHEPSPPL